MKNFLCFILIVLICWNPARSEGALNELNNDDSLKISLQAAERLIAKVPKEDPWLSSPEASVLAWGESYTIDAFVDLYEATKDPKYMKIVAARGKRVLSHRDDYRGMKDGSGKSRPAWSVGDRFVVAEGTLLSNTGQEMLKIRSTVSSFNHLTTVEVILSEDSKTFTLLVRNEHYKRYERFDNVNMGFSHGYLTDIINDPLAEYFAQSDSTIDQSSNLIRIEEVKGGVSGILASQKITLTPIPIAFAGYLGVIYRPLMRFSEIVKKDPALKDFVSDADLFIKAAEESYDDISKRLWRTGSNPDEGYYLMCEKGESMPADNIGQPFNYLAKHVCTELALYRLTNKSEYLERSIKMINKFKNRLNYDSEKDLYIWYYWYEPMTTTGWWPEDNASYNSKVYRGWPSFENFSHGGHDIQMIMEAYRMGIGFDETDIRRFANTFLKNAISRDRKDINKYVDGSGEGSSSYFKAIYQWFALGEVEPEVLKAGKQMYENREEESLPFTARLLKYKKIYDENFRNKQF